MTELCAQLLQPRLLLLLCVCFRFQLCLFLFPLRPTLLADRFRAALERFAAPSGMTISETSCGSFPRQMLQKTFPLQRNTSIMKAIRS